MAHIEGGCLCGRVRYSADEEPAFVSVCHCADCQKFSGSAFATVVGVPGPALHVSGTLKTFTKTGGSGKLIHRRFCPECGSGIVEEADALREDARLVPDRRVASLARRPRNAKRGRHVRCRRPQLAHS